MSIEITIQRIEEARRRIAGRVHRTPILGSETLSRMLGMPIVFKAELFQKTGSFKPRGALHKLTHLSDSEKKQGLVTFSAGNHAAALAYAASTENVECTVVMPENASRTKRQAAESYGARVVLHGDAGGAYAKARELEKKKSLVFVHPFDDPDIVAGAATLGLECVDQVPDLGAIVVPVGGGGLIAGVASAVKQRKPEALVYGVEPEGAAAMMASLRLGHATRLESVASIADGLAPPMAGELNFEIVHRFVDQVVSVPDDLIVQALRLLMTRCKLAAEPSGAAALAGILSGALPAPPSGSVVVVVSGGNLDLDQLKTLL